MPTSCATSYKPKKIGTNVSGSPHNFSTPRVLSPHSQQFPSPFRPKPIHMFQAALAVACKKEASKVTLPPKAPDSRTRAEKSRDTCQQRKIQEDEEMKQLTEFAGREWVLKVFNDATNLLGWQGA